MNVTPLGAREAGASPPAQVKTFKRPSWSHILIAVAAILAFVLNLLAIQDRSETTLVAVADRPLLAGEPLNSSDLRFVPVNSGFEGLDSLLGDDEWAAREGWVVTRDIPEGGVLDVASINEPAAIGSLRSMSIPVAPEHAAGGRLAVGDTVDVVSVVDGTPAFVAESLKVVGVAPSESSSLGGFAAYHVVVAVDSDDALNIAAAIDAGSIELVRTTGAGGGATNG